MDWNARFEGKTFHYGRSPAAFVRDHMVGLGQGARVLTIAEGEGRNAVWLARQGYHVTAIEPTESGRAKALDLAARHDVKLDWRSESLDGFDWPDGSFEAVSSNSLHRTSGPGFWPGWADRFDPAGRCSCTASVFGRWRIHRAGRRSRSSCGQSPSSLPPIQAGR